MTSTVVGREKGYPKSRQKEGRFRDYVLEAGGEVKKIQNFCGSHISMALKGISALSCIYRQGAESASD